METPFHLHCIPDMISTAHSSNILVSCGTADQSQHNYSMLVRLNGTLKLTAAAVNCWWARGLHTAEASWQTSCCEHHAAQVILNGLDNLHGPS